MKINKFSTDVFENPNSFVTDWYSLGSRLSIPPYKLSYTRKHKNDLVKKINIPGKSRVVYQSDESTLGYIQRKLKPHLALEANLTPEEYDHIWAYRKGLNVREAVEQFVGWKWLIQFDIRKYFDNIDFRHIKETLEYFGYGEEGAKLVAWYCTVHTGGRQTLQQGSCISGELSNLVGYVFFDRELKGLLKSLSEKYPGAQYMFKRYCDNVYLALDGEIDINFIYEYEAQAKKILRKARFLTHDWNKVPSNHPKRNQKLLGVVVNKQKRIEKNEYERMRALLFNCCVNGLDEEVKKFFKKYPADIINKPFNHNTRLQIQLAKFEQYINGKIAYINSVSEKQGLVLKKLNSVKNKLKSTAYRNIDRSLCEEAFNELKKYKDSNESVVDFSSRVENALEFGVAV